MTAMSIFQAIKASFTFSRSVIIFLQCWHIWFWDLTVLLFLCRPGLVVKSCCLFCYGDCRRFRALRFLMFMFWQFCPLSLRGDSNGTNLFCCSGLRSPELYLFPYLWHESSRLSCPLHEGMYVFRISRVSSPYRLPVFSCGSFWLLLSMELFLSLFPLRELSHDPRFRLCGMLSVSLLTDLSNSSKMAVLSVRN